MILSLSLSLSLCVCVFFSLSFSLTYVFHQDKMAEMDGECSSSPWLKDMEKDDAKPSQKGGEGNCVCKMSPNTAKPIFYHYAHCKQMHYLFVNSIQHRWQTVPMENIDGGSSWLLSIPNAPGRAFF